jgi:hypothetical protein
MLAPPFLPAESYRGLLPLAWHRRPSIYALGQGRVWKSCAARTFEKSKVVFRILIFGRMTHFFKYFKDPAQILIRWSLQHK